ncbi:E3 ubiquitin-protein ligase UPL4-like isoform X1 [Primulina tabacum]|uniref:E3 ubiquitin-protein ligase UPL4-like isoform X1 n=1 Tax=Primulina tabacum TaxID=48773 RepID=UPI003F595994
MENRGQKRTETVDELPADKRACSSFEFRPSTSNSSAQTPMSSAHEAHDAEMETSSSTSGSTRSEVDGEKESTNGSCDSDSSLRDYYRHQSTSDHTKFKKVLSSLSEQFEESVQLALLTELCELLSFCSDSSLSSLMADSFSPLLVKLARHEGNPDIILLSIRAITYLCDANPRSSGFLVRHDAVPTLCQRLMAIEYLDVAEQCLQALKKISREQPLACLQSGAIMAVLSYIDFFSTSVQRIALSTVVNICKKQNSESPSLFMEAVPILCNLLQYEDRQLVESVATCLIRIVEQVYHSPDMLDEICRHGLVQRAVHLIGLNSRTTLCQLTNTGLIGLIAKMAAGSTIAFKALLELNISSTVKDMLSSCDLSHGTHSIPMLDGHYSQIHEVLKLSNELLPAVCIEQDGQLKSDKEDFLLSHPDVLPKFGVDLLPILIRVVSSGVNLILSYGCLSVIYKLVHFSTSEMLQSLLQTATFSSFLAGVFARKDHHVILLALQIVDTLMLKLPHVFLNSFMKEGVLFAILELISPDKDLKLFPVFDGMCLETNGAQKSAFREVYRCLCYAFDKGQSSKSPENGCCKLQEDTVHNLARHIWSTFFETESMNREKGVTDILQKLRNLSSALTTLLSNSQEDATCSQLEEEIYGVLHQIVSELNEKDSISTFELVESGVIKALVTYVSNGMHLVGQETNDTANLCYRTEKRFEVFGRLLLSCTDPALEKFPLLTIVRRLQSALSSVENFPVILNHASKLRNSYATVPYGRCTSYPSLKVQFEREKGEISLRDYSEDIVNVDPFLPLDVIEGYLRPRVCNTDPKNSTVWSKDLKENDSASSHSPSYSSDSIYKFADGILSTEMVVDVHKPQDGRWDILLPSPRDTASTASSGREILDAEKITGVDMAGFQQEVDNNLQKDDAVKTDQPRRSNSEDTSQKLYFCLEGQQLDCKLTLYQSILKQQNELEHDIIPSASLWTRIYKITYKSSFCQPSSCNSGPVFSEVDVGKLRSDDDILFLLRSLERINRMRLHQMSCHRMHVFAEGRTGDLDKFDVAVYDVSQNEFVNSKLSEKLEQQMRDPMAVSVGGMPAWCTQLMAWYPFLFAFEVKCKYFHIAALGKSPAQILPSSQTYDGRSSGRQQNHGNFPRKKFLVNRNTILESAARMMELNAHQKVLLEVEYNEEVGTGLGPTLEFYTLVCHEFQRNGLGMWREDHVDCVNAAEAENPGFLDSPVGLFPRPWSPSLSTESSTPFSEVIKKFRLLGQIVAKALEDGRVLDLPFSDAFYKLVLDKELTVHDIRSFDPSLGKALLEFQAVVERKRCLRSLSEEESQDPSVGVCLRSIKIEDLCLDFTLPGYPDYDLVSAPDSKMVNLDNIEEYITLIVDATTKSGVSRQVESFKSGFDQVLSVQHLKVFTEEELERLLCGEHVLWNSDELLDYIKFDHGYTISSPPVVNLLEIMREFDREQQRAFLQFVTGAPRLPTGGLASLNPKLTIVRKHCGKWIDADLPSVMTCANYLKLPAYSTKEVMKEKLLYAITEGQGSFHLS